MGVWCGWGGPQDVWGQHTNERVHGSAGGEPGWGLVGLWPCVLTATDAEIIHAFCVPTVPAMMSWRALCSWGIRLGG